MIFNSTNSTTLPDTSALRTSTLYQVRNFSSYALTFLACAVAMTSWLVLRKEQPMRSRLLVPPFSTVLMFIIALYGVTTDSLYVSQVTDLSGWNTMRYYGYFLYDIAYVASGFSYAALICRFIVFQNLSLVRKQHLKKTADYDAPRSEHVKEEMRRMELRVKLYQLLLSQKLLVTIIMVILSLVTPLSLTIAIGTHLKIWPGVVRSIHIGIWMLWIASIGVVVAFSDVIKNRKYWCRPADIFGHRDKLRFRVDIIFAAVCIVVSLQGIILTASAISYDLPTYPHFYFIWIGDLARIFGTYMSLNGGTAFWFYMGSKTLYWLKLARSKDINIAAASSNGTSSQIPAGSQGNEEMLVALHDEAGYVLMKRFVAGEYSTENIECWTAIQKVQKLLPKKTTNAQRRQIIQELYETYVKPGSILEVNITHATREGLRKVLQMNTTNNNELKEAAEEEEEITAAVLKPLMNDVCHNLLDSFQRFKKTTEYLQFQTDYEFKMKSMNSMQVV